MVEKLIRFAASIRAVLSVHLAVLILILVLSCLLVQYEQFSAAHHAECVGCREAPFSLANRVHNI
jgi:hypothetical protein